MKSSGFNYFQFLRKIQETMSNRQAANSNSITPSKNKYDGNNNPSEKNPFKGIYLWNQIQIQLIILNKIFCKSQNLPILRFFLDRDTNPSVELQQQISEASSSEQIQTENECLRLQHQKKN